MEKKNTENEKKETKINELVFVLDRSGSMSGLESDTIGGFNSMLKKQKKIEGESYITTVLFDDRYELLHDHISLDKVRKLTEDDYYTRGCTALYDALGKTIKKMDNIIRQQGASRVMFVIITDGLENASIEYNNRQIRELIDRRTNEAGWEFVFLGANIDAETEAQKIGIRRERAARFHNDAVGIANNFDAMSQAALSFMTTDSFDEEALEKVREDYRNRK
ncbi:MAG: VWA domain-containing protein [Erysipelotrichaceae bacterium]|nr:VWA domain-containing protein [Erysipelotrichaceae bacterium]